MIITGHTVHPALPKNFQTDLSLTVVASGTTAMLTYYTGLLKKNYLSDAGAQIAIHPTGDLVFSTVSTTDTISLTASTDGTNYSAKLNSVAGSEHPIFDLSTGLAHASGDLPTGTYVIPYRFWHNWQTIAFLKSGTSAVASLAVAKAYSTC